MQQENTNVRDFLTNRAQPSIGNMVIDLDDLDLGCEIMRMEGTPMVDSKVERADAAQETVVEQSPRLFLDDCPNLLEFARTPRERVLMHLEFLKADVESFGGVIAPEQLTPFAKKSYGKLLDNTNSVLRTKAKFLCKTGDDVNWENAEWFTQRGFTVTYEKATNRLMIAISNSALVL